MTRLLAAAVLAMTCLFAMPVMNRCASAADLDPAKVSADAKWLIHVDFEQLLEGELAQQLRQRRPQMVEAIRTWFRDRYGIEPQEELRGVTMFSRSYHSYTGTVILQADYDADKVLSVLRKTDSLKTTEWNGRTLHTVTLAKHDHRRRRDGATASEHDLSGGKQMTVVMLDDTLLLASSVENAQSTLKLLSGEAPSLQEGQSELLADASSDDVIYGAAIDLEEAGESNFPLPVLQQHERITWSIGNRDGRIYENALLVAQSTEVAQQMEQVLEGLIAYERLWAPDSQPLNKLLDAVELSRNGEQVTVDWEGDTETVIAALRDLKPRLEQWKKIVRD